jgi:hypothetical protein
MPGMENYDIGEKDEGLSRIFYRNHGSRTVDSLSNENFDKNPRHGKLRLSSLMVLS